MRLPSLVTIAVLLVTSAVSAAPTDAPLASASTAARKLALAAPTARQATPLPEPFLRHTTGDAGLAVVYREGLDGAPGFALVTHRASRLLRGGATLDVSPTLRVLAHGPATAGALVRLEVPSLGVAVTHLSLLGSGGGHDTRVDVATPSRLGARVQHSVGHDGKARTLAGPTVRLEQDVHLWYGISPNGGASTLMLTGTARF